MNKMKKSLLGTVLAGAVVVGASAGTYAWFNASYSASGTITNHTLTINESTSDSKVLFSGAMLAPSRSVTDSFSIENTGSLDQILRAKLDLALYDGANNVGAPDKSAYSFDVSGTYFDKSANQSYPFSFTGIDAQQLDDILGNSKWLPDNNGLEQVPFGVEDKLNVTLKVTLKSDAGNEYQGLALKGSLKVEARQTDTNSQF
jgi:predicted ribosomally synthesized peptide with SipW-like signal peptide